MIRSLFASSLVVAWFGRTTSATVQGFDISHYQSSVDFGAAYSQGARFVIIKASEGTTVQDTLYSQHVAGAKAAGLLYGAYHFARPGSSTGTAEASYFLENGGSWTSGGGNLPGMLDLENNPSGAQCYGLSTSEIITWIGQFVDTYLSSTGRYPMIYTTANWWTACTGNTKQYSSCPLVLARYNTAPGTVPGGWSAQTIWQNSDSYTYGGDSDVFNGDQSALVALASG
ncbi:lysozyme [Fusarium proliferatum]|uniref:N,O-diacetylmuramidase n=1 Tax=Gibberella intermedia TaxID=948311 RepID=A0A365MTB6_GIBIN|nr:lysozyme [Fusarium proliferatum]